jgi:hypothetical protein
MNACRSVCGPAGLMIPARRARRRTIRAAPVPVRPLPIGGKEDRPVDPLTDGQVDRPRRAGRQPDGDDLAALARDNKSPVPAPGAQVLDIGAGGFTDPQPAAVGEGQWLHARPGPPFGALPELMQRDRMLVPWGTPR